YFQADNGTLGTRFDALPEAAYLLGWHGITVVPFDGSPARWLIRPQTLPDGGLVALPDGGILPAVDLYPQATQVEADGSWRVACAHLQLPSPDTCSIGRYLPAGDWQDLLELPDACEFRTLLLADPAAIFVITKTSLWRVDRTTGLSE